MRSLRLGLAVAVAGLPLVLAGCVTAPPDRPDNICAIFREKSGWYDDAKAARKRWGTPIQVQMAIMYQESRFRGNARPARTHLLWIIPWKRPSTAYGYTQALDSTWASYKREADNGWADRDDFGDATDFIAWYVAKSHAKIGISKWDAYSNYLAYHEGFGGYIRKSYAGKRWLLASAARVSARAKRYAGQLRGCRKALESHGHWWWPF